MSPNQNVRNFPDVIDSSEAERNFAGKSKKHWGLSNKTYPKYPCNIIRAVSFELLYLISFQLQISKQTMPDARSCILLVIKAHPDFSRANSRLSSAIIQKQMCAKYRTRPTHEKFQLFQSGRTCMDYRTERIWKFFICYFRMPDSPVANDHYHSILHTFCFSCCSAIIFLSGNEKVRVVFS